MQGWETADKWTDDQLEQAALTITFEEFLEMLAKTDSDSFNDHWKPWSLIARPCMIKYDFIGFLEDFHNSFETIRQRLFADIASPIGEEYEEHKTNQDTVLAYRNVSQPVLDRIFEVYKDDFLIGGYNRDIECI